MTLRIITAATDPVITLAEAKDHLRVDDDVNDAAITRAIAAAQADIEGTYGRALMPATWEFITDGFPGGAQPLALPQPPLIEVTSLAYRDSAGSTAMIAPEDLRIVDGGDYPSSIVLADGSSWPVTDGAPGAVTIQFRAGYEPEGGSPAPAANAAVPPQMKTAALLLIGHFYANREASDITGRVAAIPLGVEALLTHTRIWGF